MTVLVTRPPVSATDEPKPLLVEGETPAPVSVGPSEMPPTGLLEPRRLAVIASVCVAVLVVATGVVIYWIGPLVHARDQRSMIAAERTLITNDAHDDEGLYRPAQPTQPPAPGAVVGILDVPVIGLQQVVVEGVSSSQTRSGPGHVPGTAGLGQPGNSAVVGRRTGYGGPFGDLDELRRGDHIVTATTEGQSLYIVHSVRIVTLGTVATPALATTTTTSSTGSGSTSASATGGSETATSTASTALGHGVVNTATLYGPTTHDQLTLVTSATLAPWNTNRAIVVVARLSGKPFAPTPQESRSGSQLGTSGDPDALAWLILALLALGGTLAAASMFYRRTSLRSAYLLTTAPLLAFTVLAAESASRLLPAWL